MKVLTDQWRLWAVAAVLLLACAPVAAAPITAKLDRNSVVVGETVTLTLETNDTDQSLEADLSVLEADFEVLNRRSETQMSFVNGRQTASVKLVVTLEPKRAGTLAIPALKFPGATSTPLFLKVAPAPRLAPGEAEPVFIEVTVQPESGPHYVLSQIGLTVRIFYQSNLTEAAINPPAPEQASVRLLDEVPYQSDRNGERYRVLERRYAVFPERSGTLTIPPLQLTGRLIERPSDRLWQPSVRGRRVRIESDPVELEISPRPATYQGDFWLPARRLTLSQQITDNQELHVGEPVTRTVIVDAVGLEEHMLEEPRWPDLPDTRLYPDQPQGISRDDGEWVLGHKEFRYAIVPEKPGELVLPEIRLDWWDTVADQQRTAVLPAHRVTVLPSEVAPASVSPALSDAVPGPAPGAAPPLSSVGVVTWQVATGVFVFLWLSTLYLYLRRPAPVAAEKAGDVPEDERAVLHALKASCRAGDAKAARKALADWARRHAPARLRGSVRAFGAACGNPDLERLIGELDGHGFNPGESAAWDGAPLWKAFRAWRRDPACNGTRPSGERPDLYGQA